MAFQCTILQSWCCSNAWLLLLILHLPEHIEFENKKYLGLIGEIFVGLTELPSMVNAI